MPVIDVLYFDGCPGAAPALALAHDVAARHAGVVVRAVRVEAADAEALQFVGSPTLRVDGVDVAPAAEVPTGFAMRCRVYAVDGRFQKTPPVAWVESALAK